MIDILMIKNIIIAFLFLATFILLLTLLIANSCMRKQSDQPTLRELEKQYNEKKMKR